MNKSILTLAGLLTTISLSATDAHSGICTFSKANGTYSVSMEGKTFRTSTSGSLPLFINGTLANRQEILRQQTAAPQDRRKINVSITYNPQTEITPGDEFFVQVISPNTFHTEFIDDSRDIDPDAETRTVSDDIYVREDTEFLLIKGDYKKAMSMMYFVPLEAGKEKYDINIADVDTHMPFLKPLDLEGNPLSLDVWEIPEDESIDPTLVSEGNATLMLIENHITYKSVALSKILIGTSLDIAGNENGMWTIATNTIPDGFNQMAYVCVQGKDGRNYISTGVTPANASGEQMTDISSYVNFTPDFVPAPESEDTESNFYSIRSYGLLKTPFTFSLTADWPMENTYIGLFSNLTPDTESSVSAGPCLWQDPSTEELFATHTPQYFIWGDKKYIPQSLYRFARGRGAYPTENTDFIFSQENITHPFGAGPSFLSMKATFPDTSAPEIAVRNYGLQGDERDCDFAFTTYSAWCDGNRIFDGRSGEELEELLDNWWTTAPATGLLEIEAINDNQTLGDLPVKTSSRISVDWGKEDKSAPTLTSTFITDAQGNLQYELKDTKDASLLLSGATIAYNTSTAESELGEVTFKAEYSPHGSSQWQNLDLEYFEEGKIITGLGSAAKADISAVSDFDGKETLCDLRITLTCKNGNTQVQTIAPAFKVNSSTTCVNDINVSGKPLAGEWYNLQGQRVSSPVNGQLYILRNGETSRKVIF